jgi:ribosomal protein S15P/S13E
MDSTVSPFTSNQTKSTVSKQVQAEALWMQLVELHKHVQEERTEKSGRRIRLHCAFCRRKQANTAIHVMFIAALR